MPIWVELEAHENFTMIDKCFLVVQLTIFNEGRNAIFYTQVALLLKLNFNLFTNTFEMIDNLTYE